MSVYFAEGGGVEDVRVMLNGIRIFQCRYFLNGHFLIFQLVFLYNIVAIS